MFLKPTTTGSPVPPFVMEGEGMRASVTFVDDVPVLSAQGPARFTVRPAPRRFRKARPERIVDASSPVAAPLLRGESLRLSIGDAEHAWTYDPDGNLPWPVRMGVTCLREGGFGLAVSIVVALSLYVSTRETDGIAGTTSPGNEMPGLIRRNQHLAYPQKSTEPSQYMRALADAKREGRDVVQASREWIDAHARAEAPAQEDTK
jgi:hypothetical protein